MIERLLGKGRRRLSDFQENTEDESVIFGKEQDDWAIFWGKMQTIEQFLEKADDE